MGEKKRYNNKKKRSDALEGGCWNVQNFISVTSDTSHSDISQYSVTILVVVRDETALLNVSSVNAVHADVFLTHALKSLDVDTSVFVPETPQRHFMIVPGAFLGNVLIKVTRVGTKVGAR